MTGTRAAPTAAAGDRLAALRERPRAQVLIVGGGINGIATMRDLALQGVDVMLVERGDYASGATGASSHMIHGGVRYLENGEFRLVRESVRERNRLLSIAPHYVKPLQTTIPIFRTFAGVLHAPLRFLLHRPSTRHVERGALLIKAGLTMYDTFSRDGGRVPRHRFRAGKKARADLPALRPDVRYTATYFDASVHDPERLALDVLTDGLACGPHARAANYVEAIGMTDDGVLLRDTLTGDEFSVTADVVVNASGAWSDVTNAAFGSTTTHMGGTQGAHIVLDSPPLLAATAGREIFFEHSDGRIVLIYPLKGRVLVGTTDTDADITRPAVCTDADVDYFFELIRHVFPGVPVDRGDIVYRFAGIRPLPGHDGLQPGFVSRDYRIVDEGSVRGTRLLTLVGGKWTTFRALAEHLSIQVLGILDVPRAVQTTERAIGGGRGFPTTDAARRTWVAAQADVLSRERVEALLDRYGTRATDLISELDELGDTPLRHHPGYSREEVEQLVRTEQVVRLTDLLIRRTALAFTGELSTELVEELADVVAEASEWDAVRRVAEIAAAVDELDRLHGVRLAAAACVD